MKKVSVFFYLIMLSPTLHCNKRREVSNFRGMFHLKAKATHNLSLTESDEDFVEAEDIFIVTSVIITSEKTLFCS